MQGQHFWVRGFIVSTADRDEQRTRSQLCTRISNQGSLNQTGAFPISEQAQMADFNISRTLGSIFAGVGRRGKGRSSGPNVKIIFAQVNAATNPDSAKIVRSYHFGIAPRVKDHVMEKSTSKTDQILKGHIDILMP